MAAESITVTRSDGTTDIVFNKVSQNAYASRFAYSANDSTTRLFIDVDHKVSPIGSLASDVHTLTIRREELDATTNKTHVSKVSLQVTYPKAGTINVSELGDIVSNLMCLFNSGFMDGFVMGETPSGDYNVTGPFNPTRA